MSILQAIVYGIVQGLGEFLPISSTAHLILTPWLLGWDNHPGLAFDVALHLGTLAAVVIFFWKDWINLIKAGLTNPKSKDGRLFWLIVVACIPGGILGLLFDDLIETAFRTPLLIGIMLILMGIVLYLADRLCESEAGLEDMGLKRSILIGFSQALAMIPGVSRSGITMAMGRYTGMTREAAAKFTFLLSTPFIFLSGVYKAKDIAAAEIETLPLLVAVVTAAVVGALSIKFLLEHLKRKGFGIFVIYRIILGTVVIAVALLR